MTNPPDPLDVALIVAGVLERLQIPYTIGGSLASSFAGEPRSTVDVDIVAAFDADRVDPLVDALTADFYVDGDALRRAIRNLSSANLIHHATHLKVDLFMAGGTPLDLHQIARRQRIVLPDGRALFVHPPEDILLQKLRWYEAGGRVSDRQWRDILAIVRVQGAALDRDYLRTNAPILGVAALLERALQGS